MARLQYTIDDNLKKKAEMILHNQGITPKVAMKMFYVEVVKKGGIPFKPSKIKIPNDLTLETIEKAHKGIDIVECKDIDDMFNKLNS